MSNIAIVGAGLMGRLLALLLSKQDEGIIEQISLFEKNSLLSANSTGLIAAGMVAPTAESITASEHIMLMGQRSLKLWPELLTCLAIDNAWWQLGSIAVAHPKDHSSLVHFKQRLKLQKYALNEHAASVEVNHARLTDLEPELASRFQYGLLLPDEGHVDNCALYQQSAQLIKDSDINLYEHLNVELKDNSVALPNGDLITFDWVIDCRGLGASRQLLQPQALLRGVRGEVVRVRAPQVKLLRPIRVMHPRYPIYIVPKGNDEYVIGATEIESDSEQAISVRSALELLSAAYSIHSGFAEAEIMAIQTGLRPTFSDNEPVISVNNQVIQVNGLYRHGYLLTPYLLEQMLLLLRSFNLVKQVPWSVVTNSNNCLDERLINFYNQGKTVCE
ncbi:FAD-dependent oxidoreductase [Thalassotalea piscium]|uniref:D-amino-acid oxidase n=1 Tax=Thalassotalea piscium TaxID=1230533 RepID=A0A7X0NER1_9GAMM|nr:FAD-dependent oxidoreductase [Thalassotalea piscium]MBB6542097.1 glycine oxidase [Thalassotalea piscium]